MCIRDSAQTGLADQQRVTARQDRGQDLLDHLMLPDKAPLDAGACALQRGPKRLNFRHQIFVRTHDNAPFLL